MTTEAATEKKHGSNYILLLFSLLLVLSGAGYVAWRYRALRLEREFVRARTPERLEEVIARYDGRHPKEVENARIQLASHYMAQKEYDRAREVYEAIARTASAPEIARLAGYNSAATYAFEGRYPEAVAALEQLLRQPRLPGEFEAEVRFAVALEHLKAENWAAAIPHLRRVMELTAGSSDENLLDTRQQAGNILQRLADRRREP